MSAVLALFDNPIAFKDGLSRMRTWRSPLIMSVYLVLVGGLGLIAYLIATSAGLRQSGAQVGSAVFATMAFAQLALICVFTPGMAAGAVAGERERQTLDILLVTRLNALEITLGKLVASAAYAVLLLLAALPVFSAVFLLGGVNAGQFTASEMLTLVTAVMIASLSLFWSSVFRRTLGATVMAYLSVFVLMAGTAVIATIISAFTAISYSTTQSVGPNGNVIQTSSAPAPQVPAVWDLNAFYGMYTALFGTPQLGAPGPKPPDAWPLTMGFEAIIAVAAFVLAVRILRGRLPRLRRAG